MSFGVTGPYGETSVERVKKGKKEKYAPCHCARAQEERSSAMCSSLMPMIERRLSQPASHVVALAGPMIPLLSPCAVEALEAVICVRTQPPRSTVYTSALELTTYNRAQPSNLAAP